MEPFRDPSDAGVTELTVTGPFTHQSPFTNRPHSYDLSNVQVNSYWVTELLISARVNWHTVNTIIATTVVFLAMVSSFVICIPPLFTREGIRG
jgi:hypothetical protein